MLAVMLNRDLYRKLRVSFCISIAMLIYPFVIVFILFNVDVPDSIAGTSIVLPFFLIAYAFFLGVQSLLMAEVSKTRLFSIAAISCALIGCALNWFLTYGLWAR